MSNAVLDDASDNCSISLTGTSSNNAGVAGNSNNSDENLEEKIFSKREQQTVANARRLVAFVFLCCATAVSVSVYLFTAQSDKREFEVEVSFLKPSTDAFRQLEFLT